ncbi:MAG: S9 family peptidase, partial [Gammaproteobacteria bacterium]|nr:S9 family peptidase [Gammaproteobacteria bacterium]
MMHKIASLLLRTAPALLCLTPLVLDAAPATLTVERLFSAPDLSGASLRSPRFSPDGKLVTYLQGKSEAKDRLDIWAFDPASGRNALLVDSAALAADEGV